MSEGISCFPGPVYISLVSLGVKGYGPAVYHCHGSRKRSQYGSRRQTPFSPASELSHRYQETETGYDAVHHLAGPHDSHHKGQDSHIPHPYTFCPVSQIQTYRGKVSAEGYNHHIIRKRRRQMKRHGKQGRSCRHLLAKGHPAYGKTTHGGEKHKVEQTPQK